MWDMGICGDNGVMGGKMGERGIERWTGNWKNSEIEEIIFVWFH